MDGSYKVSGSGDCQCYPGFTGDLCDVYIGTCSTGCAACNGPNAEHCIRCAENYYRDTNGSNETAGECICDPNYTTLGNPPVACAILDQQYCPRICEDRNDFLPESEKWDCSAEDTDCNNHRLICYGPDERDCVKCGRDSHREAQTGRCVCNDGFV